MTEHITPDEAWKQALQPHLAHKEIYRHGEKLELAFYEAINRGETDKMRYLLEQGLPHLFSASRPLHTAARTDNKETLALLLEWGEDINGCDAFGNSPLCEAVLNGCLQAIDFLIQQGADPHVFCYDQMNASIPVPGRPLLRQAVEWGFGWWPNQPEQVQKLSAGLACLFDRLPALLPEWKAFNDEMYRIYKLPDKGRQWCRLVAEALRQRGRTDLANLLLPNESKHPGDSEL